MYLCIRNQGVCDYRLFTLLGASTSRGKDNKIGQFGSGAKHGALTLIRMKIPPVVMLGKDELTYYVEKDGDYDRLGVHFKGVKELQSVVVQFGAMDWQSPHMALREYISNAIDAGGMKITKEHEIEGVEGETRVYVPLTPDVNTYFNDISTYFLHTISCEGMTTIPNTMKEEGRIYRKGVLVGKIAEITYWHYNFPDINVDESRNLNISSARAKISDYVSEQISAQDFISLLLHGDPKCFEKNCQVWRFSDCLIDEVKKIWPEQYVLGAGALTQNIEHIALAKGLRIIQVGPSFYNAAQGMLPCVHNCAQHIVRGLITMEASGEVWERYNTVWSWLVSRKLHGQNKKPPMMMYRDTRVVSFSQGGTIFLNEEALPAEICHTICMETGIEMYAVLNTFFKEANNVADI